MPQKKSISNSKLIQSIRLLNGEEFKRFGKWLQSPWCNSNKKLYELYVVIKNVYPNFEESALTKPGIFKALYPDKDFNDRWLRNIFAELNKQIEKFLIHERIEQEQNIREILLAKTYEERHQYTRLFQLASRFKDRFDKNKNKSQEDYYHGYFIHDILYYIPRSGNTPIPYDELIKQADLFLNQFFQLNKWRYQAELQERKRIKKDSLITSTDEKILKQLQGDIALPAIQLYQQKINAGPNPTEAQFRKLRLMYFDSFEELSSMDQKIMYYYLLNILVRMSLGKIKLQRQLFEFYLEGVYRGTLIHHDKLSNGTFNNIVTLGNTLNEFDTTSTFINSYKENLDVKAQEDAYVWGMAHGHYYRKEYLKSIDLLRFHKFKVRPFNISGRVLLLQTYYEYLRRDPSYQDLLFNSCHTFNKFIYRDKHLSSNRQKGYLNFTKFISKCADLVISKKKDKRLITQIEQEIDQEAILQGKRWLKKIVADLKKNK